MRKVAPRVYRQCFECDERTVQWLTGLTTYSPGSYRGPRFMEHYTCSQCGTEDV